MRSCVAWYPRGAFSIHVLLKALSGASNETGISRVRRFLSPHRRRDSSLKKKGAREEQVQ